jgi:carbonic anhydrase
MPSRVEELICSGCDCIVQAADVCSHCGAPLSNGHSAKKFPPSADRSIHRLIEGYRTFHSRELPEYRADFERLAKGQAPIAAFVTCSDSRVQPHLITQTEPGDLFVIRNAGNIVPPFEHASSEAAAIEYAVKALDVPHIVVCGHTGCGAMSGLLEPEAVASMTKVRRWVNLSSKALRAVENIPADKSDERWAALVGENVLLQLEHMMTYPCVASRVRFGTLSLHAWVYDIKTGRIFEYNSTERRFLHLGEPALAYA